MNAEKKIDELIITIRIQRFGKPIKSGSPFYINGYAVREIEVDNNMVYSDRTPMGMLRNTTPDPIRKLEEFILELEQTKGSNNRSTYPRNLIDRIKAIWRKSFSKDV